MIPEFKVGDKVRLNGTSVVAEIISVEKLKSGVVLCGWHDAEDFWVAVYFAVKSLTSLEAPDV